MSTRHADGSAGDTNYATCESAYARYRRPDSRIAALIHHYLGDAATVLNVGAGAGSYEPTDRQVTAVEPSASMRALRPPHLSTAIDAVAEALPFHDRHFDAAMAIFTVHQWSKLEQGLRQMRRVTRGPVVIMTCDPTALDWFWLNVYAPEVIATEARRYPSIESIAQGLGGAVEVVPVPIPLDCQDCFNEAYYGRPEYLLTKEARLACSAWSFVAEEAAERFAKRLREDLASGAWDRAYGHLRTQAEFHGSLRLVVAGPKKTQ